MARAATTTDVFNAIAEPRRRQIIDLLSSGKSQPVSAMVKSLHMSQPAMSKHLGVLRKVGIVSVTKDRQQRLYRLNARQLKPVHDWVERYRRVWEESFDRLAVYLREQQEKEKKDDRPT